MKTKTKWIRQEIKALCALIIACAMIVSQAMAVNVDFGQSGVNSDIQSGYTAYEFDDDFPHSVNIVTPLSGTGSIDLGIVGETHWRRVNNPPSGDFASSPSLLVDGVLRNIDGSINLTVGSGTNPLSAGWHVMRVYTHNSSVNVWRPMDILVSDDVGTNRVIVTDHVGTFNNGATVEGISNVDVYFRADGTNPVAFEFRADAGTGNWMIVNGFDLSAVVGNIPPVTNVATADTTIALPTNSVAISGTASDVDLGPNPLATLWTASPSAGVSFDVATALNTNANFTNAGLYTIILTADDGADQTSDSFQVRVLEDAFRVDMDELGTEILHPAFQSFVGDDRNDDGNPDTIVFTTPLGTGNSVSVTMAGQTHWRNSNLGNIALTDYDWFREFLNDVVLSNAATTSPMTLTLDGLLAGNYEVTTWHHSSTSTQTPTPMNIDVADGAPISPRNVVTNYQGTGGTGGQHNDPNGNSFQTFFIVSDGVNPIDIDFSKVSPTGDWMVFNGFEIVTAANIPPTTIAGADKAVTSPSLSVVLGDASIIDADGGPAAVTASWTSTPSTGVTFDDANAVNTTVTFTSEGVYELTLTGDDTADATSDSLTIVVYGVGLRVDYDVDNSSTAPGRIHVFQPGWHSYFESDATAPTSRTFATPLGSAGTVRVITDGYSHLRSGTATVAEFTQFNHLNGVLNDLILRNDPLSSQPLSIKIENLQAGNYKIRSWHHSPEVNQTPGPLSIYATDAHGRRNVLFLQNMTGGSDGIAITSENSFGEYVVTSDGVNPIVLEMSSALDGPPSPINKWTICNGFEVVATDEEPVIPTINTDAKFWNILE